MFFSGVLVPKSLPIYVLIIFIPDIPEEAYEAEEQNPHYT